VKRFTLRLAYDGNQLSASWNNQEVIILVNQRYWASRLFVRSFVLTFILSLIRPFLHSFFAYFALFIVYLSSNMILLCFSKLCFYFESTYKMRLIFIAKFILQNLLYCLIYKSKCDTSKCIPRYLSYYLMLISYTINKQVRSKLKEYSMWRIWCYYSGN